MDKLRVLSGGITLLVLSTSGAMAEVCDKLVPGWAFSMGFNDGRFAWWVPFAYLPKMFGLVGITILGWYRGWRFILLGVAALCLMGAVGSVTKLFFADEAMKATVAMAYSEGCSSILADMLLTGLHALLVMAAVTAIGCPRRERPQPLLQNPV